MQKYMGEQQMRRVATMRDLAKAAGMPMARMALAWVLSNPLVASVLVGVTTGKQLEENLAASGAKLDAGLKAELDRLFPPA
jgi:aryl-alcohol dehydrogenase-like predicted oxidoreductase